MKNRKAEKVLKLFRNFIIITLADALYAVSFCWFFQPNAISVGGFTGISQIVNHFLPVVPIGVCTIVINIPLFIIGGKLQGFKLILSSLYSMTISNVFIDVINHFVRFFPMEDLLLAAAFGGLLCGAASGLQLRVGATTGGSELAARLLKYKFNHISVGKLCLGVDLIVILLYAATFQKVYNALYGIVAMYIFSVAMDFVIYGGTGAKMAYIVSDKIDLVKERLLDMGLGLTLIDGHGGWHNDDKKVILCAFKRNQIAAIKAAVMEIDSAAFVIVNNAHEVLGEGFETYSPGQL